MRFRSRKDAEIEGKELGLMEKRLKNVRIPELRKFIKQAEYAGEKTNRIEIKRNRDGSVSVSVSFDMNCGDGEIVPNVIDEYEFSDYFVKPLGWTCPNGEASLIRKYRRFMLEKFGAEYAEEFLFEYGLKAENPPSPEQAEKKKEEA